MNKFSPYIKFNFFTLKITVTHIMQ